MKTEWKLVPVDPTEEMHHAARDWSLKKYGQGVGREGSEGCYAAMINAAPQPPALGGGFAWRRREPFLGCKPFLTAERYEKSSALVKSYYEPFTCAQVAPLLADIERQQGELAGAQAMLETAYAERDTLKARCETLAAAAKPFIGYAKNAGRCQTMGVRTSHGLFSITEADWVVMATIDQAAPAVKDGE